MRPWDPYDWNRFNELYKKGNGSNFNPDYVKGLEKAHPSSINCLHLSGNKIQAISYAKYKAPAAWAERVVGWEDFEEKFL